MLLWIAQKIESRQRRQGMTQPITGSQPSRQRTAPCLQLLSSPGTGITAPTTAKDPLPLRWLEGDSHGFIIPGSEWGQSLKHWIHMLVGRPAPGAELIVDPPRSHTPIEEDERTLLEQVRERRFGPNSWVNILVYDRTMVGDRSEEEIAEALAEARRMRREDEDETRSMLGREF
jgi:hypothetical protein